MRQARNADAAPARTALSGQQGASGTPADCRSCPYAPFPPGQAVSSPAPSMAGPLGDWIDSQANVLGLWLDRLIEQGDPADLISMVHRQQLWLELMRGRLNKG
jgi:hypothetical protein